MGTFNFNLVVNSSMKSLENLTLKSISTPQMSPLNVVFFFLRASLPFPYQRDQLIVIAGAGRTKPHMVFMLPALLVKHTDR